MTREEIQEEALKAIAGKKRSSIAVSMGVGKTLIALQHMSFYNFRSDKKHFRFLIVIPKVSLKQSWLDEMDKHGLSDLKDRVVFTTYRSLNKQSLNFDCVYLDECHSILPHHATWLCKYENDVLGLTGTPPKSTKSDKYVLLQTFAPIRYNYLVDEAVKDNILNNYRIVVHAIDLNEDKTNLVTLPNGAKFKVSERDSYDRLLRRLDDAEGFAQKQKAYILIINALKTFDSKVKYVKKLLKHIDNKCIIFCNTKDQADQLATYSFHSSNPNNSRNLKWFQEGKIDKLSCVSQLNEGINVPDLKSGIIMHSYSNERQTTQRIGRLLRLPVDQTAVVHVIVYKDTLDEIWLAKSLLSFDPNNISYAKTHLI
jgi:superfamily II DNA or RNA helicase